MNDDDFKKLGKILDERLEATERKFEARLDERLEATERKFEARLDERLEATENIILGEIGKFVSDQLLPTIDEKADKTDIDRIERKLDTYIDKTVVLESRVSDIESLPTVAHELKLRKKR